MARESEVAKQHSRFSCFLMIHFLDSTDVHSPVLWEWSCLSLVWDDPDVCSFTHRSVIGAQSLWDGWKWLTQS